MSFACFCFLFQYYYSNLYDNDNMSKCASTFRHSSTKTIASTFGGHRRQTQKHEEINDIIICAYLFTKCHRHFPLIHFSTEIYSIYLDARHIRSAHDSFFLLLFTISHKMFIQHTNDGGWFGSAAAAPSNKIKYCKNTVCDKCGCSSLHNLRYT